MNDKEKNHDIRKIARVALVVGSIFVAWIAGSLLMQLAGRFFASYLQLVPVHLLSVIFFILLASFSTVVFLVYAEPVLRDRHRLRLGLIFVCFCLSAVFYLYVRTAAPVQSQVIYVFNSANLVVFANLVGAWIITPVKRPPELVPLCMVMVLADLFSVFRGPSRKIAESITTYYDAGMAGPPPVADFILLKIVVPGIEQMPPVFGVSDWIIVAFFTAAAARFGFNDNVVGRSPGAMVLSARPGFYLPVSALGLLAAVQLAGLFGLFLPALPMIVLFFMGYIMIQYSEARRLEASDWRLTLGVTGVMLVGMSLWFFSINAHL